MNASLGKRALAVLDGLLALAFFFMVLNVANSTFVFRFRDGYFDYLFRAVFYLAALRVMAGFPWASFIGRWGLRQRCASLVLLLSTLGVFYFTLVVTLPRAAEYLIFSRAALRAESNEESLSRYFERHRWYPRASFVARAKEAIPEDAAIAWFGDLRPQIVAQQLYPRRVYALPELQLTLDANEKARWIERRDPLHPPDDRYEGRPAGFKKPESREALQAMIRDKGIEWAIFYDALRPEETYIARLASEASTPQ